MPYIRAFWPRKFPFHSLTEQAPLNPFFVEHLLSDNILAIDAEKLSLLVPAGKDSFFMPVSKMCRAITVALYILFLIWGKVIGYPNGMYIIIFLFLFTFRLINIPNR